MSNHRLGTMRGMATSSGRGAPGRCAPTPLRRNAGPDLIAAGPARDTGPGKGTPRAGALHTSFGGRRGHAHGDQSTRSLMAVQAGGISTESMMWTVALAVGTSMQTPV